MINNKEQIKQLLNFTEEGDFYQLMVLKRKKDQPEGERDNHQSVRTIKTYCIDSVEYLEKRWDEIVMLCENFRARAYIQVCKQNHKDVSLNMMVELAERMRDGVIKQQGLFDSVVGQMKIREQYWIVDVDSKDMTEVDSVKECINNCRPHGDKIKMMIPTKQGYHLITNRFDVMEFEKHYPETDIQRKNPTLLYFPNSLDV